MGGRVGICLLFALHLTAAAFTFTHTDRARRVSFRLHASSVDQQQAKVGDLLGQLPTPSLLLELSLMEKFLQENDADCTVEEFLTNPKEIFVDQINESSSRGLTDVGPLYVHTSVTSTEKRDAVTSTEGSGKSLSVCNVDTSIGSVAPGGAYLGLGLANHHVGGYYWARSMGIGASLPAHGIYFGPADDNPLHGELYWKKRGPGDVTETTEESSNSNDGKRSEWADFLAVGDTVQLVLNDPLSILANAEPSEEQFNVLVGIRRAGRPLGADPIVEKIWTRTESGGWQLQ